MAQSPILLYRVTLLGCSGRATLDPVIMSPKLLTPKCLEAIWRFVNDRREAISAVNPAERALVGIMDVSPYEENS